MLYKSYGFCWILFENGLFICLFQSHYIHQWGDSPSVTGILLVLSFWIKKLAENKEIFVQTHNKSSKTNLIQVICSLMCQLLSQLSNLLIRSTTVPLVSKEELSILNYYFVHLKVRVYGYRNNSFDIINLEKEKLYCIQQRCLGKRLI